jgi:hypothetical protein
MVNYQNGKIYRIVDNTNGNQYIGSTTLKLSQRLAQHVADYKVYLKSNMKYLKAFDILATGDYIIILIECFPCTSKEELLSRERYWQECLNCINKNKPIITAEEKKIYQEKYREDHQQEIKQYHKSYYIQNKVKYQENSKKEFTLAGRSKKVHCECGGKYIHQHRSRHINSQKHQEYLADSGEI